jgi:hypothetical protein
MMARVSTAIATFDPTSTDRRENRSMNGPVNGPTREKGIVVTARILVTWPGVCAASTEKIRNEASAIWYRPSPVCEKA